MPAWCMRSLVLQEALLCPLLSGKLFPPHTHAHTRARTHTQTRPRIPERSLWGLLVHHFGYYPSLAVKYLCPAGFLLMRRFFSGPHEFFRWPIALLHWSPRSLRWADGSELQTSRILLTIQRGEFVCQSSSSRVCSRHTHTHTHTAWLRIPSKPSKPILFCLLFCLCAAIFLSLFTFHSKFSLKCKGFFLPLSLIFLQSANFPSLHLRIISYLESFASLSFSASHLFSLYFSRAPQVRFFSQLGEIQIYLLQWANYSHILFLWISYILALQQSVMYFWLYPHLHQDETADLKADMSFFISGTWLNKNKNYLNYKEISSRISQEWQWRGWWMHAGIFILL